MGNFLRSSRKLASAPYLTMYAILLLSTNSFAVTSSSIVPSINSGATQASQGGTGAANFPTNSYCISNLTYDLTGPIQGSGSSGVAPSSVRGTHAGRLCVAANGSNPVSIQLNPTDFGGGQPSGNGTSDGHRQFNTGVPASVYAATGVASSTWPDYGSAINKAAYPISDAWATSPPSYCAYQSYNNPITDYWVFNATGSYTETLSFLFTNTTNQTVTVSDNAEACCYVGGPGSNQVMFAPGVVNVTASLTWTAAVTSGYEYSQIIGINFVPGGSVGTQ